MGTFIGVIVVVVVFLSIIGTPSGLKPWDERRARKIGRRLSRRKW